jgi:hypothetical protein
MEPTLTFVEVKQVWLFYQAIVATRQATEARLARIYRAQAAVAQLEAAFPALKALDDATLRPL